MDNDIEQTIVAAARAYVEALERLAAALGEPETRKQAGEVETVAPVAAEVESPKPAFPHPDADAIWTGDESGVSYYARVVDGELQCGLWSESWSGVWVCANTSRKYSGIRGIAARRALAWVAAKEQPEPPDRHPPLDLVAELRDKHIPWSKATFGEGHRMQGILKHIRAELDEIEADPHDCTEWIDVVILALDGAWRHGHDASTVVGRLFQKLAVIRDRTYPKPTSEDEPSFHDEPEPPKEPCEAFEAVKLQHANERYISPGRMGLAVLEIIRREEARQ